jgi:RimJ/RimL family protein N-acetyltransferase
MFRKARDDDLVALMELERTANLAALDHVFPPDRYPFPADDVLARWRLVMDDPAATVMVADDPASDGLIACAAYDDTTLRHLAVRPDHWGQRLATHAIETALDAMDRRGGTLASLWCLQENHRARKLYEYLGWRATGDSREAPWPPHPVEMRYTRLVFQSDR